MTNDQRAIQRKKRVIDCAEQIGNVRMASREESSAVPEPAGGTLPGTVGAGSLGVARPSDDDPSLAG